jgi:hypothetical protein
MPHSQVAREMWAPQVEITMRKPQVFVTRIGIERERKNIRAVQNAQVLRDDLDVAGGELSGSPCRVRAQRPRLLLR